RCEPREREPYDLLPHRARGQWSEGQAQPVGRYLWRLANQWDSVRVGPAIVFQSGPLRRILIATVRDDAWKGEGELRWVDPHSAHSRGRRVLLRDRGLHSEYDRR